LCFWYRVHT